MREVGQMRRENRPAAPQVKGGAGRGRASGIKRSLLRRNSCLLTPEFDDNAVACEANPPYFPLALQDMVWECRWIRRLELSFLEPRPAQSATPHQAVDQALERELAKIPPLALVRRRVRLLSFLGFGLIIANLLVPSCLGTVLAVAMAVSSGLLHLQMILTANRIRRLRRNGWVSLCGCERFWIIDCLIMAAAPCCWLVALWGIAIDTTPDGAVMAPAICCFILGLDLFHITSPNFLGSDGDLERGERREATPGYKGWPIRLKLPE